MLRYETFYELNMTQPYRALALCLAVMGCQAMKDPPPKLSNDAATTPPPDLEIPQISYGDTGEVSKVYNIALAMLHQSKFNEATGQFDLVEANYFDSPVLVAKAQLLGSYSGYMNSEYSYSIEVLNRFVKEHPASIHADYAYYLKALCYYEQMLDKDRDQIPTFKAISAFEDVIVRFPHSRYTVESKKRIAEAQDLLAAHDLGIGRFYEQQHLYAAALGRFGDVVSKYQGSTQVPEALYRLVEVNLSLGMTDQARAAARVLAYNYPSSSWNADTYKTLVAANSLNGEPAPTIGVEDKRDSFHTDGTLQLDMPETNIRTRQEIIK